MRATRSFWNDWRNRNPRGVGSNREGRSAFACGGLAVGGGLRGWPLRPA